MQQRFMVFALVASAASYAGCSSKEASDDELVVRMPADEVPAAQPQGAPADPGASHEDGAAGDAAAAPVQEAPETSSAENEHAEEALSEAQGEASDSCCAAHDAPGCGDAAIEACVCAADVLPQCCTDAWSPVCVEVVRQRHCDPGVRECVCTQWEQTSCCEADWTNSFCDTAAELKCGASVGCHQ